MKTLFCAIIALLFAFNVQGQLKINEVCYDPSNVGLDGDTNGDSTFSPVQDEFIEVVNVGTTPLDVSKYRISDLVWATSVKTLRHTVGNIILPPGGALVIFGGGRAVGTFGNAAVEVDRGTQGLSLGNSGEALIIEDSLGVLVDSVNTDIWSDNPNESYTRKPDLTGAFTQHRRANPAKLFSPGFHLDGTTPFVAVASVSNLLQEEGFGLFPNPGSGFVSVTGLKSGASDFQIIDLSGKQHQARLNADGLLDVRHFAPGLYMVKPVVNGSQQSVKLLITK
jgi:Lamin Tail Domain/Secretion system C-terminal sorting domain